VIIEAGTQTGAPEIGIAATVGKTSLQVIKPPSVAVISTGDELVPLDQTPLAHQIRSSNAATLAVALEQWHIRSDQFHIVDDLHGTTSKLGELLESHQILILSGGVSKGKFDYVPQSLDRLKVKKHFHRIKQRPGKPFWFGSHPSGTLVFAFPGNPVSSFMCFNRYLKPWLNNQLGIPATSFRARLTKDIHFTPDLTYLAQVKITVDQGEILAHPVEGRGSGDLANLVDADGFIELPQGRNQFLAGEQYPVFPYRKLGSSAW
jgi:molybdopterin molybdotransferase